MDKRFAAGRPKLAEILADYDRTQFEWLALWEVVGENGVMHPDDYAAHDDTLTELCERFAETVRDMLREGN